MITTVIIVIIKFKLKIQGFIEFILGNSEEAKFLRNKYIIKIIPMLNPGNLFEEKFLFRILLIII